MTEGKRSLRDAIQQRVSAAAGVIPTSSFERLGKTAVSALRTARLARRGGEGEPDIEALAAMVSSIGQLKGVAMKLGQIMSYIDVALPEDVRAALAVLQTHAQAMPYERVAEIVRAELGDRAPELLAGMETTPAAAASIGQVHRAVIPGGERVAVKVQYPEIEAAIAGDFGPAAAGTRMASVFYPGAGIEDLVREARERFLLECDYRNEARCQRRFFDLYADHPVLAVPRVHEAYCGRRVLTTAWVEGARFDDYLLGDPPAGERDRAGEALFSFYVGTLFQHGLYNCDPHPGNYVLHPGGRITVLDYGCTRAFDPDFVDKLAGLTRAVHADTREALHAAFLDLGMVRAGKAYDFDVARDLVRSFYGPMLRDEVLAVEPGAAKTMSEVLADKRALMKLHLPGEFLFLFRIRFGLMSILARLGARANWYRLEQGFVEGSRR